MSKFSTRQFLVLSLRRALLGEIHHQLLQASIEADETLQLVRLRFEYDGEPDEAAWDSCSCAAAEVISDFTAPWTMDEEHIAIASPSQLQPLAHIVYRRRSCNNAF